MQYLNTEYTLWDRFDVPKDLTLREFLAYIKDTYHLTVTMLSCGVILSRLEPIEAATVERVRPLSCVQPALRRAVHLRSHVEPFSASER